MSGPTDQRGGAAGRIPSLDGVRAVSITLVLVSHLIGTRGFPIAVRPIVDLGELGVRVFFVLSGFLITGLLRAEWERTGRIDLRAFYIRRTLRIFPAFYAYLVVVALLSAAGVVSVAGMDLLRASTYTVNYVRSPDWLVGHAWSLSVEEQFYLTWPLLVLLLTPARAPRAVIAAMVLAPVMRVVLMALPDGTIALQHLVGSSFETVVDAIAAGSLLALVRDRLWAREPYRRLLGSRAMMLLPLVVVVVTACLPNLDAWLAPRTAWVLTGLHAAAGITLMNVAIALVIDRVVRFPTGPIARLLNLRPVAALGALSYSVYLWQQPFLDRSSGEWAARFPQNILLVISVALLSYHLVEQPMLRLRDRLLRP